MKLVAAIVGVVTDKKNISPIGDNTNRGMLKFIKVLFLATLLLLAKQYAVACNCPSLPKLDVNYCNQYELIFKGRVTAVTPCKDVSMATFKLSELYKGMLPEEIEVLFDCSSDCSMNLSVGEEWIIYANFVQHGKPRIEFCSRSRKFISNENVIQNEYVNTDLTFNQERSFLQENLGLHHFMKSNTNAELSHQNIKPSTTGMIILVLVSVAVLILFYYLFNKFFK